MINSKQGLLVAFGGMIGTALRYGVFTILPWMTIWSTLLCNLTGAFLLAMLYRFIEDKLTHPRFQNYRLFLGIGLFGGYTTFSTISLDIAVLIEQGTVVTLLLYIAATFIGGFIATASGYQLCSKLRKVVA